MILMTFPQVGPHFRPPRSPAPASDRTALGEHGQPDRAKYVRNLRLQSTSPAQYAGCSGDNGGRQHPASRDQPAREPLRRSSRVERRLLAQTNNAKQQINRIAPALKCGDSPGFSGGGRDAQ